MGAIYGAPGVSTFFALFRGRDDRVPARGRRTFMPPGRRRSSNRIVEMSAGILPALAPFMAPLQVYNHVEKNSVVNKKVTRGTER